MEYNLIHLPSLNHGVKLSHIEVKLANLLSNHSSHLKNHSPNFKVEIFNSSIKRNPWRSKNHLPLRKRNQFFIIHSKIEDSSNSFFESNESNTSVNEDRMVSYKNSILGGILSQAAQTYLTSQLDSFKSLQVHVKGHNLQLLKGNVSSVHISGENVVFKGLSLTRVQLRSSSIQFQVTNPEKILKDSFTVDANISISHLDMSKCLLSPMGISTVKNIFEFKSFSKIEFLDEIIKFSSTENFESQSQSRDHFYHLSVSSKGQILVLKNLEGFALDNFRSNEMHKVEGKLWKFDLGPNTCISDLQVSKDGLFLKGKFTVVPYL